SCKTTTISAARWTWRCSRTARCWCRTITPARSTASATTAAASPRAERILPPRPSRAEPESRLRVTGKMLDTATRENVFGTRPSTEDTQGARRRISFPHREDHHALLAPPARRRPRRNTRYATRCCRPGGRPAASSVAARLPVDRSARHRTRHEACAGRAAAAPGRRRQAAARQAQRGEGGPHRRLDER